MDSHFVWQVSNILFKIPIFYTNLSLSIRWYSVMFALGILGAYYIIRSMFKAENKSMEACEVLPLYIVIATVIGARLGHVFFYHPMDYLSNPINILKVWRGGLASHGGFLFVILSLILISRQYKESFSFFWLADRCAIAGMFSAGCIRIGNFFNSEIFGNATDLPWAVVFANVDQVPRHPTQLYESFGYFYICFTYYIIYRMKKRNIGQGRMFGAVMVSGFGYRMFIERFKENHTDFVQNLPMNMGQMLSIPFILLGIYLVLGLHQNSSFWNWAKFKKNHQSPA